MKGIDREPNDLSGSEAIMPRWWTTDQAASGRGKEGRDVKRRSRRGEIDRRFLDLDVVDMRFTLLIGEQADETAALHDAASVPLRQE